MQKKKTKIYLYDLIIEYLEQDIAKIFDDKANVKTIKGITLVKDTILLKEMAKWSKNLNI